MIKLINPKDTIFTIYEYVKRSYEDIYENDEDEYDVEAEMNLLYSLMIIYEGLIN